MGHTLVLTASDGHRLSAYVSEPAGTPRGGIVVIQEIFGVTRHIRDVADQYAASGYLAIAPALFDRAERDAELPYTEMHKGIALKLSMDNAKVMLDIEAAAAQIRSAGKIAVIGYCWGGSMAYLAAARLRFDAAVAYYGGDIGRYLDEKPVAPILFHFGKKDPHILPATVAAIRAACPDGIFHVYPADHGFNCTERASYEPASAALAFQRSARFLHENLG